MAISKYKTKKFGQNPIEWLNVLAKDEKNNDTESHSHTTASTKTCIIKLKDRSMRLYKNATKAVYDDYPYTLSPSLAISSYPMMTLRTYKSLKRKTFCNVLFTYILTHKVLMNYGYLFDEEYDNEDFIVDSVKTFSIDNTSADNT